MNHLTHLFGKKIRGFTMVETILASVISIIIMAFVTSFFLNIVVSKQEYILREEVNYSSEFALGQIIRHLKQTTVVDTVNSLLGEHPGKITIQTAAAESSPLVIESTGADLRLSRGSNGPYDLITSGVRVTDFILRFATPNNTPGTFSGQLTLQSTVDSSIQRTETFSVNLRTNI